MLRYCPHLHARSQADCPGIAVRVSYRQGRVQDQRNPWSDWSLDPSGQRDAAQLNRESCHHQWIQQSYHPVHIQHLLRYARVSSQGHHHPLHSKRKHGWDWWSSRGLGSSERQRKQGRRNAGNYVIAKVVVTDLFFNHFAATQITGFFLATKFSRKIVVFSWIFLQFSKKLELENKSLKSMTKQQF